MPPDYYFQRFGFCGRQVAIAPHRDLGIIVVIPCFNEPDLLGSLEALWACDRPGYVVEVIVVVNSPSGCAQEIRLQNENTLAQVSAWSMRHRDPRFAFQLIHFPDLPAKQAGVGLARKIGMDEAIRRFEDVSEATEGVLVGFDADCTCTRNYLTSIERHFRENPRSAGCSIYFEHPLEGPLDSRLYEAIAAYELHLRYYVQALRYTGFPHAHHTIGACMAVRADAYIKQGGMNRRKAGEDFYFLQKIIPLGSFRDLTDTTIIPSPRPSERVPFGTGKAVQEYLEHGDVCTYPLQAFLDLKVFFDDLPDVYRREDFLRGSWPGAWPESVRSFLDIQQFSEALREMRENTSTELAFRNRFFHWFNGFRVMKFVNRARDRYYGKGKVNEEASKLLALLPKGQSLHELFATRDLLAIYRQIERSEPQRCNC